MATVGSVVYDARINTSGLRGDARNAERITKDAGTGIGRNVESGTGKASSALSGLTTRLVGVAASLTAVVGVTKLVGGALSDLSGLQTARSGFEVLTGSAEKASKVMGDIANYANNTPFEFPEIAKSARTLLGFGVAAEDVDATIRKLGDAVAASGAEFSGVSRVFGQIFAAGKLNAEDFNQLIDNGIALGPEIAKQLGIPISELKDNIADGAVTVDVFQKALNEATSEGGKYFGATDKLALTLNGRLSTLQDTFTGFIGTVVGVDFSTGIVNANGAFAIFSDLVKQATDLFGSKGFQSAATGAVASIGSFIGVLIGAGQQISEFLMPKLTTLWSSVQNNLIPILKDLWENVLLPLIPVIGTTLVVAIGGVVDIAAILLQGLGWLYQQFKDGNPIVLGLAGVFGSLALAMAFGKIFSALSLGFALLTNTTIPLAMGKVTALRILISSPIGFGAIAIGAALGALALIKQAADNARAAIDAANAADTAELDTSVRLMNNARDRYNRGDISKSQLQSELKVYAAPARASGGPVSANKPYFVGENSDGSLNSTSELFVPKSSGNIVNSRDLQNALGNGGNTGGSIENNIGNIYISSQQTADYFIRKLSGDQEITAAGLVPHQKYMGAN